MKRTLLMTALFLGFTAAGFTQNILTLDADGDALTNPGTIKVTDENGHTFEAVVDNPHVTVFPGETVIIYENGLVKMENGPAIAKTIGGLIKKKVRKGLIVAVSSADVNGQLVYTNDGDQ